MRNRIGNDPINLRLRIDRVRAIHVFHLVETELTWRNGFFRIEHTIRERSSIAGRQNAARYSVVSHADANRGNRCRFHDLKHANRVPKRIPLNRDLDDVRVQFR